MAVRPLVTTGAALLSAGALIATTPALFVPRSEITVAAEAPAPQKLTQEQIRLLALSLQGAWQSFTQGYGGIYIPGQVIVGYDPVTEEPIYEDAPGDCTAEGAECLDGFPGLAYYLSDNILPLGPVDNIFFEGGFTELARQAILVVAEAIDDVDPTGRLDLAKRVNDFFDGGATQLVGNLLLDNLPQDGYAYGLTNSFFFGYGANTGITATITYIVDAIAQGTPTPTPNLINPLDSGPGLFSTEEEGASDTTLLAKQESGVTTTELPEAGSLLKLSTPKFESPFKNLVKLPIKAPAAEDTTLVQEPDATEDVVKGPEAPLEGGTEANPLGVELPKLDLPKFEAPKAPEFKAPELKLPELKLDPEPTTTVKVKEKVATEKEEPSTGVNTKTGNKVSPPILFGNGGPKGESNGSKFLKKLGEAVQNATGGGDDDSGDGGDK
ncbi:hypothetical protein [Mycolicibacterium neworleansense]|uniref:Uncharacterized protein n=1 Tax=Mycolicibacterium neworleansense TaxID=146018 RepID=A0A0H5RXI0_9MYCO|nr:hypothetical protein [Mycolicibacterium neworleansense]MCV7362814.1 hypothetical protein [Mycolicibacterium neworleansense]CRZ18546.1 hypothetical protein BN2156_05450 [Mycolicibacterium neworleansense]